MADNTNTLKVVPQPTDWRFPDIRPRTITGRYSVQVAGPSWDPRPRWRTKTIRIPAGAIVTLVEWCCGAQGQTRQFANVRYHGVECIVTAIDLEPMC